MPPPDGTNPPPPDTDTGAATESTLQAVKGAIDGVKTSVDAVKGSVDDVKTSVDDVNESLTALTTGTANSVTHASGSGFDDAVVNSAVSSAQTAYAAKYNEVKTALHSMFTLSAGSGGQLPVFHFGTIYNTDVTVDLNRYAGPLSYVGYTIIFAASVMAVLIFLS